jgi:hypothetical protein
VLSRIGPGKLRPEFEPGAGATVEPPQACEVKMTSRSRIDVPLIGAKPPLSKAEHHAEPGISPGDTTPPVPGDDEPVWYSSAWLVGSAALDVVGYPEDRFPVPMPLPPGTSFSLKAAELFIGASDERLLRQRIDISCKAKAARLEQITEPILNTLADLLAFHTLRRVAVRRGPFTTAPPGATEGPYRSVAFGVPDPGVHGRAVTIPTDILRRTATMPELQNIGRNERVVRSMRWLRRSFLATDVYLEFAALAFGLEAIVSCLPRIKGGPQGTSDRLRTFALTVPGITESRWTRVGRLRHALFHGGITESSESSERVHVTTPIARLALIAALKSVLQLPQDALPELPEVSSGYLSNVTMELPYVTRGDPADEI